MAIFLLLAPDLASVRFFICLSRMCYNNALRSTENDLIFLKNVEEMSWLLLQRCSTCSRCSIFVALSSITCPCKDLAISGPSLWPWSPLYLDYQNLLILEMMLHFTPCYSWWLLALQITQITSWDPICFDFETTRSCFLYSAYAIFCVSVGPYNVVNQFLWMSKSKIPRNFLA